MTTMLTDEAIRVLIMIALTFLMVAALTISTISARLHRSRKAYVMGIDRTSTRLQWIRGLGLALAALALILLALTAFGVIL